MSEVGITKEEVKESVKAAVESIEENPSKEDLTQVKTLQQIAIESGQETQRPLTPEQYQGQLLLDHMLGLQSVVPAFKKLSSHGKDRLFTAICQLPQASLEVKLKDNFEKSVYLAAQKCLMAKHAIVFTRAKQEAAMEAKATAETEKNRLQNEISTANVEVSKEVIQLTDNESIKENENV